MLTQSELQVPAANKNSKEFTNGKIQSNFKAKENLMIKDVGITEMKTAKENDPLYKSVQCNRHYQGILITLHRNL